MRDRIAAALRAAEGTGDQTRLTTLRLVMAAIRDRDLAVRAEEDAEGADEGAILQLLRKMVEQRNGSANAYEEDGRIDLAERERQEASVILEFLPKPLTAEQLEVAVADAIEETGASGIKDLGKVMGVLKARFSGRIDYGATGAKVLQALS